MEPVSLEKTNNLYYWYTPPPPPGISWTLDPPTPLEFPIPSMGEVWIFSGTTQYLIMPNTEDQTPVDQKADNFIQRISRYPADKMYWLENILSAG